MQGILIIIKHAVVLNNCKGTKIMKKIINGLAFILVVGFSGLSSASTVKFKAFNHDQFDYMNSVIVNPFDDRTKDVSISYDSTNWQSINSAILSVKLVDDIDLVVRREFADISLIEGHPQLGIFREEVGALSDWHFNVDVSKYLTLNSISTLDFVLKAEKFINIFGNLTNSDFIFKNAKLTVDYNAIPNAVPVPAALFLFAPALLGFLGLRRKAQA